MKKSKKKKNGSAKTPAGVSAKAPEQVPVLKNRLRRLEALKTPYIIALCVILFLGWWRLSSRPISAILGTDRPSSAVCTLTRRDPESGTETYWEFQARDDADLDALADLLNSVRYRPDFGNLWLGGGSGSSGRRDEGTIVYITLGREDRKGILLLYRTPDTIRIEGKTFHPTDSALLDRLASYVEEHGNLSETDYPVGHAQSLQSAAETPRP